MLISQLFQTLLNTQPLQNTTLINSSQGKVFDLIGFVQQDLSKVCGT